MWVTQDGHELVLPRAGLDAVAAHLSGGAACAACATATRRKVAAMVARLVAGARRTPAVVRTPAGAPRQLFAARAGGRPYGIVTRPMGDRRHVITAVRPRPATSHEELRLPTVTKQITVTVDWRSHATLDAVASKFPFAGVYVVEVERDGKWVPIYVGKADTETVSRRWRGRLRVFRELDIPLPKGYRVWAAEVHRRVLVTTPRRLTSIDVVESILIRQLLGQAEARRLFGGASHALRNVVGTRASSAVVVPAGLRVEITHTGTAPATIAGVPGISRTVVNATTADVRFELPPAEDA